MYLHTLRHLGNLQLVYRLDDLLPHSHAVHVACFQQLVSPHGRLDRSLVTELLDEVIGGGVDVAAKIFEANNQIDVSDILHQVQAPILIIHGRGDAVSLFDEGRRLAASIPLARLVELDTANHIPMYDEPVMPRIVAEINDFLAQHPAS